MCTLLSPMLPQPAAFFSAFCHIQAHVWALAFLSSACPCLYMYSYSYWLLLTALLNLFSIRPCYRIFALLSTCAYIPTVCFARAKMAMVCSRSLWSKTIRDCQWSHLSLFDYLAIGSSNDGIICLPDPEPQETRMQVPAAMGRQSEGSILNASTKWCLDYAHVLDWVRAGALSFEIISIRWSWNWYGLCIFVCCTIFIWIVAMATINFSLAGVWLLIEGIRGRLSEQYLTVPSKCERLVFEDCISNNRGMIEK